MRAVAERLRYDESSEDGNIIIAILVMMVGTAAVLAVMSSVVSGLGQARTDQSRSNAFQYANAGIDHALYRIDTKDLPTTSDPTTGYTVVSIGADGKVSSFTDQLNVDGVDYDIQVTQDPIGQDTVWKVRATGQDASGKQRLAIANIEAKRTFENGFFTLNEFRLTGHQEYPPVAYDSSVPGCVTAPASCELKDTAGGRLGTNDRFTGANGATVKDLIDQWPGGFAIYGSPTLANAQSRCFDGACHTSTPTPGNVINEPEALTLEVPEKPATTQPCPTAALGGVGTVPPGDYLCNNVHLQGNVRVSGATGNARIWIEGELSASTSAVVNKDQRPMRMQFYMDVKPAGYSYSGSICGANIWAVLMTPSLPVNCTGSHQPHLWGVVVADMHYGTGNHFDFHWDVSTRNAFNNGKYHIYNWRECPPGTVTDC